MLLVSFHGGSGGVENIYAYDTATGLLNSQTALQNATLTKAELRGMVYANSYLYVVNGAKGASDILCFQPPASGSSKYEFTYAGEFLAASISSKKGLYKTAIGHPYAVEFDGAQFCYVSNQDTNVVAQATVSGNAESATIEKGCQSAYLKGLTSICPATGCVYLDGTFVASQDGALPDVDVAATNVSDQYGGLQVKFASASDKKVQNSVRDIAISNGVLMVCDEPAKSIRLYSLPGGNYLGSSPVPAGPTHMAILPDGLYVSADNQLYWSALSNPPAPSSLRFQSVLTAPASNYKIGGVTFDASSNTAWVAFQLGTGTTGSGAIYSYGLTFAAGGAPTFGIGSVFATLCADTPEFVLYIPNP
jgi:hypothetical protein